MFYHVFQSQRAYKCYGIIQGTEKDRQRIALSVLLCTLVPLTGVRRFSSCMEKLRGNLEDAVAPVRVLVPVVGDVLRG